MNALNQLKKSILVSIHPFVFDPRKKKMKGGSKKSKARSKSRSKSRSKRHRVRR